MKYSLFIYLSALIPSAAFLSKLSKSYLKAFTVSSYLLCTLLSPPLLSGQVTETPNASGSPHPCIPSALCLPEILFLVPHPPTHTHHISIISLLALLQFQGECPSVEPCVVSLLFPGQHLRTTTPMAFQSLWVIRVSFDSLFRNCPIQIKTQCHIQCKTFPLSQCGLTYILEKEPSLSLYFHSPHSILLYMVFLLPQELRSRRRDERRGTST